MTSKLQSGLGRVLGLSLLLFLSACGNLVKVQPWEKAFLAKPEMRFGSDALIGKNAEQTYASKEASAGGVSVGGGGCGCN